MKVARIQAGQERFHSSLVMWVLVRRFWVSSTRPSYITLYSASPTANRPTAINTTSMPSISSGTPPV